MNTKLIIAATVAAFSLATSAFAGEGAGDPFPYRAAPLVTNFDNATLPENGQNGPVQSANSLPRGAMEGTVAYTQAQSVNHWYAQQADHRFAQQAAQGRNG